MQRLNQRYKKFLEDTPDVGLGNKIPMWLFGFLY